MIRSIRWIIAGLAVSIALLASLIAPAGASPSAVPTESADSTAAAYGRYYGAIALSRADGAVGWSYDFSTKRKAGKRALKECRKASDTPWSCRKVAWVRNGCLALAVRWNDNGTIARYKWGVGRNKAPAYRAALNKCGWGCVRRAYTCTTR
jgi:hypothetical protein